MTTPLKPDHEKRPFRFKLEGPFLRVSTMLLITPISPNFKGLKCSVFGRFRALQSRNIYGTIATISIHALREEGDRGAVKGWLRATISIHALREEGDRRTTPALNWQPLFLSTPSVRRATDYMGVPTNIKAISIHALREEGDQIALFCSGRIRNFYPRPP